jgi:hypothetical protein
MNRASGRSIGYWIFFGLILLAALVGILSQLFIASQMRLTGDDYCYNAVLSSEGFWKMQRTSYTEVSMYNGNRYALTLFSGLFGLFPMWGTPLLIITSILLWLWGAAGLIFELARRMDWQMKKGEAFLLSAVLLNFILVSAPDLQQSLFWRSGMLPYFLPLVGVVWLGWLVLIIQKRSLPGWFGVGLVWLLTLLFSGFSESGTALLIGLWGIGFLVSLILTARGRKAAQSWLWLTGAGLLGALIGLALLYYSPSTALRRVNLPDPLSIPALINLLFWNLKVFFWQAVMRRTTYLVLPVLLGLGLGIWLPQWAKAQNKLRWGRLIGSGASIVLTAGVLIALVFLPGTYIFADYPPPRALILAQFVMLLAEILGGIWLSELVKALLAVVIKGETARKVSFAVLGGVLIGTFLFAPILLVRATLPEIPRLRHWSALWQDRHEQLIQAGAANAAEVHVVELDSIVNDIAELSPDPGYWYNNCAEMYYGIDAIYADQPGW